VKVVNSRERATCPSSRAFSMRLGVASSVLSCWLLSSDTSAKVPLDDADMLEQLGKPNRPKKRDNWSYSKARPRWGRRIILGASQAPVAPGPCQRAQQAAASPLDRQGNAKTPLSAELAITDLQSSGSCVIRHCGGLPTPFSAHAGPMRIPRK